MNPGKGQFEHEQPSIDNPDDFLSLPGHNQPDSQSQKEIAPAPPQGSPKQQKLINESQPPQKIQVTLVPLQFSSEKPLITKEPTKLKKREDYDPSKATDQHKKKKRIKKITSSDEEESFGLLKQRKKTSNKQSADNRSRKPVAQPSNRGRGKPRGRVKGITSVQEIKRELQELKVQQQINLQEKPGDKNNPLKKASSPSEAIRQEYQPTHMHWQSDREEEDVNSMQAQLCEDSCMHRLQSHTYKKIIEIINQEGDNIIKRISELPFILY